VHLLLEEFEISCHSQLHNHYVTQ